MSKDTYLLYAKGGSEQTVADDLRLMAIDVWVPMVLEGRPDPKRGGRNRAMIWHERPLFPNYIFADMAPYDFYRAQAHKWVSPRIERVPHSSMANLRRFMARIDEDLRMAQRARERGETAPPSFSEGDELEIIGGPLSGLLSRFRRVVEDQDGWHVVVEGGIGEVKLNPRDVRRAG
jgi:transcription antitermination factor NusG